MTDAEVKAALSPSQIVAVTLFGETRGEPIEGKVAVGSVIRNRVFAGRFGSDYTAVCLKKWQFSCWQLEGGAANYDATMGAARALLDRTGKLKLTPALRECVWVAEGVVLNVLQDRVKGCTHYMTKALFENDPPSWAKGLKPKVTVGGHVFFGGVR